MPPAAPVSAGSRAPLGLLAEIAANRCEGATASGRCKTRKRIPAEPHMRHRSFGANSVRHGSTNGPARPKDADVVTEWSQRHSVLRRPPCLPSDVQLRCGRGESGLKIVHIITSLGDGGAEGVRFRLCTTDEETVHEVISSQGPSKYGPLPHRARPLRSVADAQVLPHDSRS
jgi:hypothetical protein